MQVLRLVRGNDLIRRDSRMRRRHVKEGDLGWHLSSQPDTSGGQSWVSRAKAEAWQRTEHAVRSQRPTVSRDDRRVCN